MAEVPEIDGYSDLAQVAKGGFGVVYRARQDRFGRVVAIKVLNVSDLDDRARQRFERECIAMGSLGWHPNVVAVFDSGIAGGGQPYLVMEYLDAGSLGDRLTGGPLPWQEAVVAGVQVAGALGAAHAAGTLHRDLKPDNLLVGPFGETKLGDFGIAAVEGAARTTTGHASFTVLHVAPEILEGHRPDELSDIYGLASTLQTLIAGSPPFAGDPDEPPATLMMRVLQAPPPRLRDVPGGLADLLERTLAKDPAERPQTAGEFGRILQAVQADNGQLVTDLRLARITRPLTPSVDERDPTAAKEPAEPRHDSRPTFDHSAAASARGDSRPTVDVSALPPTQDDSQIDRSGRVTTGDDGGTVESIVPSEPGSPARLDAIQPRGADRPTTLGLPQSAMPQGPAYQTNSRPRRPASGTPPNGPRSEHVAPPAKAAPGERRGWLTLIAVGVVAAIGAVIVAAVAASDGKPQDSAGTTTTDGETASAPSDSAVSATIEVGTYPSGVAVGGGYVWVANTDDDKVSVVDPASNEEFLTVGVGQEPSAVAIGAGAVWVTNGGDDTVTRIDFTTEVEATIPVGDGPRALAVGEGSVWVANFEGTVSRIDPASNEVITTTRVGQTPSGIAVSDGSVWVANSGEFDTGIGGSVSRLDTATGTLLDTIELGGEIGGIAAGGGSIWTTDEGGAGQGTVNRIDPSSLEVQDIIDVGVDPVSIAFGEGSVWVGDESQGAVSQIRIDSLAVKEIGLGAGIGTSSGLVVNDSTVWVAAGLDSLVRIDL